MLREWALLVLALLMSGCSESVVTSSVVARDSAGVRVVEHSGLESLPLVVIPSEPEFGIGWGEAGLTFGAVPVGVLLDDGAALVFDEAANVFHRIPRNGHGVTQVGSAGEGPGEYRDASSVVALAGDTIVVYDRALGRLSRLDRRGAFLSSGSWTQNGMVYSRPAGVTASGRLTWIPSSFVVRRDQEESERVMGPLITSGSLGEMPDTISVVPLLEIEYEHGRAVRNPFMVFGQGAGYQDGFVWTFNEAAEIRWLSEAGAVVTISRWDGAPTIVDDAVWARYDEAYRASVASRTTRPTEEQLATQLRSARESAPGTLPPFTFSVVTREGEVWISDYTMMATPSDQYVRFGSDGVAYQRISFPGPIRILDVRDGRVLGVMRDEWDVQGVVVFDIGT